MKFRKNGLNEVLDGDGFYVSYNAHPGGHPLMDTLSDLAAGLTGNNEFTVVQSETALVSGRVYRILNGDFRKDYEGIVDQGLQACIDFYDSQKDEHCSVWSTD